MKISGVLYVIAAVSAAGVIALKLRLSNKEGGRTRDCFSAIYSFGDSITDTGNALLRSPESFEGRLPYGKTFGKPTGRCSDGRLIIDFIAEASGMPLLDPYLNTSSPHSGGVNFAVSGATALNSSYFRARNINPGTEISLEVQIDWFLAYKSQACASKPNCSQQLAEALFVVGEIGFNDFFLQFLGKENPVPIKQVEQSIGDVVAVVERALRTLIERGSARRIMVPNNLPIGCWPCYLSIYPLEPRNSMGCMPRLNKFARLANHRLQQMLGRLQTEYSGHGLRIAVADYYAAAMRVLRSWQDFGIKERLVACCGDDGSGYRFNISYPCGISEKGFVCNDPGLYFSWDGVHLTESAYAAMASLLLDRSSSSSSASSPPLFPTLCNRRALTELIED